jgi:hypothetical protein
VPASGVRSSEQFTCTDVKKRLVHALSLGHGGFVSSARRLSHAT